MLDAPPVVGLLGTPAWAGRAMQLLRAGGFAPVTYALTDRWLNALLDRYPALLLIDAAQPAWMTWVIALKAEQATRRVPVLVIAAERGVERIAQEAGADGVLGLDDLDRTLIARAHGRRHAGAAGLSVCAALAATGSTGRAALQRG
jgi:DNA-binding response OmpR family regulator